MRRKDFGLARFGRQVVSLNCVSESAHVHALNRVSESAHARARARTRARARARARARVHIYACTYTMCVDRSVLEVVSLNCVAWLSVEY